MEVRKVQCTHSGTFFVSLPKSWAKRVALEKGAVLAVSESVDGRLCLDPQHEAERKPLAIVIKPTPYLDREIVGRYLLGYDEMCIQSKNGIAAEERALVKQTSSRLVGLEIVDEDYERIVLQCLLEPAASSPETILLREYNIAASMHRDSVRAFLEGDANLAKNVIARDVEVNRFYFLLVRILRAVIRSPESGERLKIRPIDCLDYRLCASLVETIGDRAVEIAHKALALKDTRLSREVSLLMGKFHSAVFEAHDKAMKAFLRHNVVWAEEVRDERSIMDTLFHDMELGAKKWPSEIVPFALAVASSIYRIFGYSVDIGDLVMPLEL